MYRVVAGVEIPKYTVECVACSVSVAMCIPFKFIYFYFHTPLTLSVLMLDTGFQNHGIPNKTKVNAFD